MSQLSMSQQIRVDMSVELLNEEGARIFKYDDGGFYIALRRDTPQVRLALKTLEMDLPVVVEVQCIRD